jgi:pyrroloquinoline quinone biosynthesis protein B
VPPPLAQELPRAEAVLGLVIEQAGSPRRLGYFPACGKITAEMIALLEECDVMLFDGTFWDDDELKRAQPGARSARQMGHVPLGGDDGTLAMLAGLRRPRKILLHINNTNPILDRDSVQHRQVIESGWQIAEDGWDIQL